MGRKRGKNEEKKKEKERKRKLKLVKDFRLRHTLEICFREENSEGGGEKKIVNLI